MLVYIVNEWPISKYIILLISNIRYSYRSRPLPTPTSTTDRNPNGYGRSDLYVNKIHTNNLAQPPKELALPLPNNIPIGTPLPVYEQRQPPPYKGR